MRIFVRAVKGSGLIYLLHLARQQSADAAEWSIYHTENTQQTPQIAGPREAVVIDRVQWQQFLTLNTWHQIRITVSPEVNGQNLTRVFIDGTERGSRNVQAPSYGTANWTLTVGHFDGDIDELRIRNVVSE
jgi:hypothetical protein